MKKTLSILLALALAILLAFPAFAVEMVNESFEYAFDTLPAKYPRNMTTLHIFRSVSCGLTERPTPTTTPAAETATNSTISS